MDTIKRYALSSLSTFVAVGLMTVGQEISAGTPIMWTTAFWLALLMVAARAGVKAVIEGLAQQNADLPKTTATD